MWIILFLIATYLFVNLLLFNLFITFLGVTIDQYSEPILASFLTVPFLIYTFVVDIVMAPLLEKRRKAAEEDLFVKNAKQHLGEKQAREFWRKYN